MTDKVTCYGKPLTRKEQMFANSYMDHYDLEQRQRIKVAAEEAGCSTAVFKHEAVQTEIANREKAIIDARIMNAQEILEMYSAVARGQVLDSFGLDASLDTRLKALDSLAKRIVDNKEPDNTFTVRLVRE